ncbi:MAG: DUF3160 domain-containing protein [Verrucomicrobiales bacterium]|nr:DUF3160 domain-containing protein [Verrucomicrobiales bacterium]
MKTSTPQFVLPPGTRVLAFLAGSLLLQLAAQTPPHPTIAAHGPHIEMRWFSPLFPGQPPPDPAAFQVEASRDLTDWIPLPVSILGDSDTGQFSALIDRSETHRFFRVHASLPAWLPSDVGAEVFGYGRVFDEELAQLGQISVDEFVALYPPPADYLSGPEWDPTTATYFDAFDRNAKFRLNDAERAVFQQNGFVVSERLGSYSFADVFYKLWIADLPVFISTDAILQAWHRSFDALLQDLEIVAFTPWLGDILDGLSQALPEVWAEAGDGPLGPSIQDVDLFVAVARSLLRERPDPGHLGQSAQIAEILDLVSREQLKEIDLFGYCRSVDFSQFKVRGHYQDSIELGRYFQASMWLGRVDFRIAGEPFSDCRGQWRTGSTRELGAAMVLRELLNRSGELSKWTRMNRLLEGFVGRADSMNVVQLDALLDVAGLATLADLTDESQLVAVQEEMLEGSEGTQEIIGHYFVSPFSPAQVRLPRAFTFLGQRFVLDSWAMGNVSFDRVIWDADGNPDPYDKVMRRVSSGLDVVFSVLGNDQVVPELAARMVDPAGHPFRDGLPYQHNLAAVRNTIDRQLPSAWEDTLYLRWLNTLRGLSEPTTSPALPEAMRTRAWAMKAVNTQLASWTQLRHDTILYAKQPYTPDWGCSYPAFYVEPVPLFWSRLRSMADGARDLILSEEWEEELLPFQDRETGFLAGFSLAASRLETIARKELAAEALTSEEVEWLGGLIEDPFHIYGGRQINGWYPKLFFANLLFAKYDAQYFQQYGGSDKWDALVADVQTDLPCDLCGDPGRVLHEAVGNPHLLLMAVQWGDQRFVAAGPVISHYEFELVGAPRRMSDGEWHQAVYQQEQPAAAPWTGSYLVSDPIELEGHFDLGAYMHE